MITENRLLRHSDENRRAENSCRRERGAVAVWQRILMPIRPCEDIMGWDGMDMYTW